MIQLSAVVVTQPSDVALSVPQAFRVSADAAVNDQSVGVAVDFSPVILGQAFVWVGGGGGMGEGV